MIRLAIRSALSRKARSPVASYTRHYDAGGINLDFAYWKSFGPGGLDHARIRRITTESSNPQIQFLGIGLETGQDVAQGGVTGGRGDPNVEDPRIRRDAVEASG